MAKNDFDAKYRKIAFWTIVAVTLIGSALVIAPFFQAIMWATVLSVLTYPIYSKLRKRFNAGIGAAITVFGALALIVLPFVTVGAMVAVRVSGFVQEMDASAPAGENGLSPEHLLNRIDDMVQPMLSGVGITFDLSDWYEQNRKEIISGIRDPLTKFLSGAIYTIFTLVIALLTMFFMLRDGHRLREPALAVIPLPNEKAQAVLDRMKQTIRAVFVGVVLVALAQGLISGLLYWVTGVPNWFLWMFATTIICVIPLLGAPVIYVPLAIILAASGKHVQAIILLAGGFGIVSQIDNLMRPFLIGAKTEQHYMAIFFSLLGGVLLWGPVGIMAGPILLTLLLALYDIIREARTSPDALEESAA